MTKEQKKPASFIFGNRPESITASVEFKSVTGADVKIDCQYVYRTRKEFAALWDEISDVKMPEPSEGEKFSFAKLADQGIDINAERTLKYLTGWPLELKITKENLAQLFDEEPAAPAAFWGAYRKACTEGVQGNSTPL